MSRVTCIFCRNKSERAKEHIWPRWIQNYVNGSTKATNIGRHISPIARTISERKQSGESLVYGNVCKDCNSGWMSDLETQVIPIIKDVYEKGQDAKNWSKEDSKTFATWAFKTILMINVGSNYRNIVRKVHFKNIYNLKRPPKEVQIEIGLLEEINDGLEWRQTQVSGVVGPESSIKGKNKKHSKKSYVIGFTIGSLITRVIYWPDHSAKINTKSSYKVIWPEPKEIQFNNLKLIDSIESMGIGLVSYDHLSNT